jgi:flagella basal body P-ring formation protein FlgA
MNVLLIGWLAGGVTVTLPMETKVRGTEIRLGEVARVSGDEAELVRRVEDVELGYAPSPGYSRLITTERVLEALRRALPDVDVRLAGERACRVWPETLEIVEDEVRAEALAALSRHFAGADAGFELAEPFARVVVPAGARAHRLRATVKAEIASGVIGVPVEVLVDDVPYRTLWTSWRVDVWSTLSVLERDVKAGQALSPKNFTRARVRVTGAGREKPLSELELDGAVAAHDLPGGTVVRAIDVHRPTVVTAQASLFLRVRKGAIEARVPATALESGAIGDRIRVRTVDSGQELGAVVRSRDLVEVDLGS